jgi:IS4 transposase
LRRVRYRDDETGTTFEFLTNNFDLPALQVALLYKQRWQIELFFKWIKQHLKVKSFWGHSENAVKIQVYTAIITYVTVSIMKQKLKITHSNYEILQVLSITLLNKTPINQLFDNNYLQSFKELNHNQLDLF